MDPLLRQEIWAGFREEVAGHVATLRAGLEHLAEHGSTNEAWAEMQRAAHTIKGAAAMIGATDTSEAGLELERLCQAMQDPGAVFDAVSAECLVSSVERIEFSLEQNGLSEEASGAGEMIGEADLGATSDIIREAAGDLAAETAGDLAGEGPLPGGDVAGDAEGELAPLAALENALLGAEFALPTNLPATPPASTLAGGKGVREGSPFLDVFLLEAEEYLNTISSSLRRLDTHPEQLEELAEVRRSVHTLKGAASMVGLQAMADLSHRAEDLLDAVANGEVPFTPAILGLLHDTSDALRDMASGGDVAEYDALLRRLEEEAGPAAGGERETAAVHVELPATAAINEEPARTEPVATDAAGRYVRVPVERLDEMVRLVSELVVSHSFLERQLTVQQQETAELGMSVSRVRRIASRLDTEYAVSALRDVRFLGGSLPGRTSADGFDSIEMDRYTEFHLICRDLNEASIDLQVGASKIGESARELDNAMTRIGRFVSDVQDQLMRVRLVPLSTVVPRLHRAIRVAAELRGKDVRFAVEGDTVELDKTLLEELSRALDHLLRNAVDHGIEDAATRLAAGKPAHGTITLRATQESGQVVLSIADDGRGFQTERLRKAAVARGVLSEEESREATPQMLQMLAFRQGVSTAEGVDQISGRGIGLDVLRDSISRLRGSVTLETKEGAGSTFTLRLPISLAITRVVLVREESEVYAIPQSLVSQIIRIERSEVLVRAGHHFVETETGAIPMLWLRELLRTRDNQGPRLSSKKISILLLDTAASRVAIAVDQVVEARDVVVKPLGALLQQVRGVDGATILGDGSVVLILNPEQLTEVNTGGEPAAQRQPQRRQEVLIVDDSLTVRRLVAASLTDAGFAVISARDGVEALEYLRGTERQPDCMLVDVEMPRMDGFELTRILRHDPNYRLLPIVMLTSRAGDKHRRRAAEVGANAYLIKPYHERTLVDAIETAIANNQGAASMNVNALEVAP